MPHHAYRRGLFAIACLALPALGHASGQFAFGANGPNAADARLYNDGTYTTPVNVQPFGAFSGGERVAACDVNGDGQDDLIVGAGPGGTPRVKVYDGRSGALIQDFFAYTATITVGIYVAAGDIDGDHRCDIVTGLGEGGPAEIKVFSGRTGAVLRDFLAFANTYVGGVRVAAGDVNGDGHVDLIAAIASAASPEVRVFDGVGGNTIRDFFAYAPAYSGGVYVAAADVNFDGYADIITGPGSGSLPQVREFSGLDNSEITSFYAFSTSFTGGVRVGAGDSDHDGIAEIVMVTGAGTPTEVKITYATSPAPADGFFPYVVSNDGGFVAVAPRNDVIFANGVETP